jgi:signal transduction histidine kinase
MQLPPFTTPRWENFLRTQPPAWKRYAVAIVPNLALIAVSRWMGQHPPVPISFLYLAVAVQAAFYGGLVPGLVSGALASLAVDYFYTEPVGKVLDSSQSDLMFCAFLGTTAFFSFLASSLRNAYQEARQAQVRAEQAIHSREFTLAAVSHDLRQPLSALTLQLQLLLKGSPDLAVKALRNLKQMDKLIQDLMDASRIEEGTFVVRPELCEPLPFLMTCIDQVQPQAEARKIRMRLDVPPSFPPSLSIRCGCNRSCRTFSATR